MLLLSGHYEDGYAVDLIGESAEGVGYLLKDRVGDVEAFTEAVARGRREERRLIPRSWDECSVGGAPGAARLRG